MPEIFQSTIISQLLPLLVCAVLGIGFILLAHSFALPIL